MARTRSFKELVRHEVATDPAFAEALSREIEDTMLTRDVAAAKIIRRDYLGIDDPMVIVTERDGPV